MFFVEGTNMARDQYRIAPGSDPDRESSAFDAFADAACAALDMDITNPLEGDDEWCVFVRRGSEGPWINLTR